MAAKKKKPTYKVHDPTIDDAINFAGVLSAGGLAGQAQNALARIEREGMAAGLAAVGSLIMGALANRGSREELRDFLFSIWKTTEDEQATEKDLGIEDRLEPRYIEEGEARGEYDKSSPFYRKLKRFHKLPMSALIGIGTAFYKSDGFKDFLDLLRASDIVESGENSTSSSESTSLESVK